MTRSELLLRNLPEFLHKYDNLTQYISAVGEFLDETEEAIINLSSSHKYDRTGDFGLDSALKDLGFELPSNVTEKTKRMLLRDGIQYILKSGTEDAIIAAFRIIGIAAQMREGWIVSPDLVRKGFIYNITEEAVTRYNISENSYQDFMFGTVAATDDGVFFNGYLYDDFLKENLYENIPIFGENYDTVTDSAFVVGKSPYVMVTIDDATVNLVTEENIDPITGEVYSYTENERYKLVTDIIKYFVFDTARPTHMRILVTITPAGGATFVDGATITDGGEDEDEYTVVGEYPEMSEPSIIFDDYDIDAIVSVESFKVGDPILIGLPSPYASQFSLIDASEIGSSGDFEEYDIVPTNTVDFNHYPDATPPDIPLYGKTVVTFTSPSDTSTKLEGIPTFGEDPILINTYTAGTPITFSNAGLYHLLRVTYVSSTDEVVPIHIVYG